MAVKKEVFTALDKFAKPGAVLASNTSYLNIDEIAKVTNRPQDVLGMDFDLSEEQRLLKESVDGLLNDSYDFDHRKKYMPRVARRYRRLRSSCSRWRRRAGIDHSRSALGTEQDRASF